ncbi:MAG TPA: PatB family C-S lyase [Rhodanobacteraceae bacterium]
MPTPSVFDFDHAIDRRGTHAVKYAERGIKFGRADVMPLWVADMDFAAPPCVAEALAERARHPIYGYTTIPDSFHDAAIDWYARRHGWHIPRDNLLVVPGTLPALASIITALTQPGDGVITQPPVYGPFEAMPQELGRRVIANPLRATDGRYAMDLDALDRQAAQARLLLLCNPHNPVGRAWTETELDGLLAHARRHHLVVFSDEVHGDLAYPGTPYTPLGRLAERGDRIISAVSPAKPFNVQGLPLCVLAVSDATLRDTLRRALAAHHLENLSPFALTAAQAAWRDGEPWLEALLAYLQTTRDMLADTVNARLAPLRLTPPEASYLAWLDCRGLNLGDAELADFFVNRCGLGLNPGRDYGAAGSGFMRLNFAAPRARIQTALAAIQQALAAR